MIKPSASRGAETFKPLRVNEIRDLNAIDLVSLFIEFAGVAELVCVKGPGVASRLNESVQVHVRIAEHLDQFVAGGDGPLETMLRIRASEHKA